MQIVRNDEGFLGCLLLRSNVSKLIFIEIGFYSHCHRLSFDISVSEGHDASIFRAVYYLMKLNHGTPKTSCLYCRAESLRIPGCCFYNADRQNDCG